MSEIPVEILELPKQLRQLFTGMLPEAVVDQQEQRESNFLSRALAAYAVHKLAGCSIEDAANSVVDGGGDGGIDAIYYAATSSTFFVVQSKYVANGQGEPELGDVTKFKTGLENLLQGKFDAFKQNEKWRKRLPQIEVQIKETVQVCPVLVYSGIQTVSEDRLRLFEDLKQRFSAEDDYLDVRLCNLTTVYDWLTGADLGFGAEQVELTLLKPGWLKKPYETVFGLLPLKDLANLYMQHGKRLVAANIRAYKGSTEVNEQILTTIQEEPESFFYLNNGLTAYCDRLVVNNLDRGNPDFKRITAYRVSIVNGAQTLGSVAQYFQNSGDAEPEGYVFVKMISLQRCENDRAFAERITRSTNFQNQISSRDFVALDEQQARIAQQLLLSGIVYHYKDAADTPDPDESNFTLQEATVASACLTKGENLDDFCARIVANRASLWSMEVIDTAKNAGVSRYSLVFRADRSARTVWRAVQVHRLVSQVMQENGKASTGVRKAFFENACWVLLAVVFIQLKLEQGNDIQLNDDEKTKVSQYTVELAERLWRVCDEQGYTSQEQLQLVFSDVGNCRRLRAGLLKQLADDPILS
ncbi:AIPR family protein [Alkalinema sp. FACHB-956]|uniref:AIPR family protein n=1 Tax=Alkalinema sp. FACHB-956 TaxID=2692768 RepID=UPI001684AC5E|nr:AIPR family protein [Alkalinema sp. FACHB-956]MBD2327308.1 AIPR family protein [Alkalinema sp. FACHB-956]